MNVDNNSIHSNSKNEKMTKEVSDHKSESQNNFNKIKPDNDSKIFYKQNES